MYELIQHQRLDSAASSITFSNIPQIWDDLVVVLSVRSTDSATTFNGGYDPFLYRLNSTTTGYSSIALNGVGNAVDSDSDSTRTSNVSGGTWGRMGQWGINNANQTSNTFSSVQIYMPNYRSSSSKSISTEYVTESNVTNAFQSVSSQLWANTSAINTIAFALGVGSFVAGSSATLYGINRTSAFGKPKAIGGNITYANGYWVHTFTGSGTFIANEDLDIEALIVAGGGGGGGAIGNGGGGGAGGALTATRSLAKGTATPVIVGAGGVGMRPLQVATLSNGFNSQFLSTTAFGGGGGGGYNNAFANAPRGADGGSGGGAWSWASQGGVRGLGTAGQGNDGGLPTVRPGDYAEVTGGGGGAGAPGGNGSSTTTGNGGDGILWNGAYYAGGGGGGGTLEGTAGGTFGLGGLGGGGRGGDRSAQPDGSPGQANTGGGGGGNSVTSRAVNPQTPGNGGSGVVIVRYRA